ncbi:M15 family metallopeptidase [Symbiobacterium thermophilum]|uniref:Peptidase n=2 Tax=Symbiobacterium thermophilum TaxID=2734 RepID=A0A953I1Q7_SYMTR|nr:M15 family metallopeptidase [Symbiobacterium thermophilum]MBY6276767.1 peptidase [Symbiobacterium thermophilum]BAD40060.1 putative D-alanyl-D-alanine carboxypeptidase [Symbiobacterium thermophilum IAM 14863]
MSFPSKQVRLTLLALLAAALAAGCAPGPQLPPPVPVDPTAEAPAPVEPEPEPDSGPVPDPGPGAADPEPADAPGGREVQLVADPTAIDVLVNKQYALPADYVPPDLVEPNVRFIFTEWHERRLMRAEAAAALEEMFAAAEEDGIYLAGVSGYRSYEYQEALFASYVSTDGLELAERYSARPGHSEHQTGLAMDISGSTGECAADDCFAGTPEAEWLAAHAHEFGFIVRYPKGKEHITGYMYEPWHVRYLGRELARAVYESGLTYEEYLQAHR